MDTEAGESKSETDYNINRKIFVGNVSYRVRSRKLSKFFSRFGEVEYCYVVKDHLKKWSRGIAFVTFKTEDSMQKALDASEDELVLDDRQMRVKPAELSSKTKYWQDSEAMSGNDDDDDDDDDFMDHDNEKKTVKRDISSNVDTDEAQQSYSMKTDWQEFHHTNMECGPAIGPATTIDDLFDELLMRIFSLLSVRERLRIERVCRRWRHLARGAWSRQRTLGFTNMFRRFDGLTDKRLDCVLTRCGQYLESLDLSGSPRLLTDFAMDVIAKHCPDMLQLDISTVKVTDVSLRNLVARCVRLRRVRMRQCLHITDQGITNLLRGSPEIEQLDLTDLHTISGQCFQCAGEKMKKVTLYNCHKMRDSSVEILAKRCGGLEDLNIAGCRELSSATVRCICQRLLNLKTLNFSGAGHHVDSTALERLANLQSLEHLDLSQCQAVNDSVLTTVSHGCKRLRHLNISGCGSVTDVGVSTLTQLKHLQSIDVSYLNKVTGEVFVNLAVEGRLKKLVARATKFLTDEVIVNIAALSPSLSHLDLSGCFHITNKIFEGFRHHTGDDSHIVELYLGGTSVDWIGQDVDWLSGFSHLQVYFHNLAMEDLRPDRELILPDYVEDSDDEGHHVNYEPVVHAEAFEGFADDWNEDDGGNDGFDDGFDEYLDNDDPLAQERWDMS